MPCVYDGILKGVGESAHFACNAIFFGYFALFGAEGECCGPRNTLQGHKTNCDGKTGREFATSGFLGILCTIGAIGDAFDCSWPRRTVAAIMFGVLVKKITGRKKDTQMKIFQVAKAL